MHPTLSAGGRRLHSPREGMQSALLRASTHGRISGRSVAGRGRGTGPTLAGMTLAARPVVDAADGRTRHYGQFYGVADLDGDDPRPVVVVLGNCQTEALRVLLDGSPAQSVRSVRVVPIFEMTADDVIHLDHLLARTDVLIVQPVADGYRGMPLGSDEIAARLPRTTQVVRVPSFFYGGLYPWQVLVRTPESGDPPGVPYLDLRTVLEAATGRRPGADMAADGIREIAAASVAELARRQEKAGALPQADLIEPAGADACHVVNHPGNTVLVATARRIQEAIGVPVDAVDPGRVLLSEVFAPLDSQVIEALGLAAEPRTDWRYRGETVPDEQIREVQLAWLREHPEIVSLGMERHTSTAKLLGWL